MKRILLYIVVFIVIGEVLIRFDQSFTVLEENRIVKMATNIELTPEYNMLKNNTFVFSENDLRIMVIGDSYIHGGGIEFKDNFSQQLKKIVKTKSNKNIKTWILDVSKSSSNNLDNNRIYFSFVEKFKPNIVILGYNLNDIEGELEKKDQNLENIDGFKEKDASGLKATSTKRKIYKLVQMSHLIHFIVSKAHRELNTFGVIFPNSKFDVNMKSYTQDRKIWKKSKILLQEVIEDSKEKGIKLLVYKFADMSEYSQLFSETNKTIKTFFNDSPSVIYVDGNDYFDAKRAKEYRLSKYDAHPNEKAHKQMAEDVFEIIQRN